MTVKTRTRAEASDSEATVQDNPADGVALEADYAEDRPIALLAEQQREFQKSLRGYYGDVEMPPA